MLLKLHYAKFDVSRLFRSKVIEEKPLGGRIDPLVKEGLRIVRIGDTCNFPTFGIFTTSVIQGRRFLRRDQKNQNRFYFEGLAMFIISVNMKSAPFETLGMLDYVFGCCQS